jgi:hypothetical protein
MIRRKQSITVQSLGSARENRLGYQLIAKRFCCNVPVSVNMLAPLRTPIMG